MGRGMGENSTRVWEGEGPWRGFSLGGDMGMEGVEALNEIA